MILNICSQNLINRLLVSTILVLVYSTYFLNCEEINPYKVLGVPRNANDKQIRSAYKNLAKDW